ncbi:MAG: MFS transporter [Candidatus Dormiibacterota bacterium]
MITLRKRSSVAADRRNLASLATPASLVLLASSIGARLPLAMLGLGLLVHAQRLSGSFAVAGLVTGAYAIVRGIAAPSVGRLVDRCGQTIVLLATAFVSAVLLAVVAFVPATTPPAVLILLAAGIGLATPPLAACVRTLLPDIVADPEALPAAYALESTALELTFIFGPPLALGLAAAWSTSAALVASGLVLLTATAAFAAQPVSRHWRPRPGLPRRRGGALRSPGMQTLVLILVGVGAVFGAVDVGVTAAATALGNPGAAAPLFGLWGVGSLLGGIAATRLGGGARRTRGLLLLLAGLTLGHAALAAVTGNLLAAGVVLLLAGAAIAPTYASIYTMADKLAPAGTLTEAFAWLLTAASIGTSAGAAIGGAVAQSAGAAPVFVLAGGAGALAMLVAVLRSRTVDGTVPARGAV